MYFAVKHKKSQQVFALLEDGIGSKMRVVGPDGRVLLMDESEFHEDYLDVNPGNATQLLSLEQVEEAAKYFGLEKKRQEITLKAEKSRQQFPEPKGMMQTASLSRVQNGPAKSRTRKTSQPSRRFAKELSWASAQLSFYRHKIEPLGPKDSFVVTVDGIGKFRFLKEQFDANFSDIRMDPKYREYGIFAFSEIPDRALKFKLVED